MPTYLIIKYNIFNYHDIIFRTVSEKINQPKMCHVETRTLMAGSILLIMHRYPKQSSHYYITINIMKEQLIAACRDIFVTFSSHFRNTIEITQPSIRLVGPNLHILLISIQSIGRCKKFRLNLSLHSIFDTFAFFTNFVETDKINAVVHGYD